MEHLVQENFTEDPFDPFAKQEIDEIFTHLPQVAPPPSLIDDIMVAITRIPLSEVAVSTMPLDSLADFPISAVPEQSC